MSLVQDLDVGTTLPPLVRTMDLVSMVAYAGATWDWHRMHYDREYVEATGFDAPVVDGQVFGAIMAEHLQDELGPTVRLATLAFRFRSMVFAGDTIRCDATCTALGDGVADFELTITATRPDGADERVAVTGTASVRIPA